MPAPETLEREKEKLWVTDAELDPSHGRARTASTGGTSHAGFKAERISEEAEIMGG
jgi:hypothetical protein